jgi:transcriptional regulator with XRE-family HTH domain
MKFLEILKSKNITQYALAKRLGISRVSVHDWISGKSRPRIERVLVIADFLKIEPAEVLKCFEKQD